MEYVHINPKNRTITMKDTGFPLYKIRESVRFSFYEDLYILSEVLNGVKYLHDKGIFHNDIHEGNIILQKDGGVKIIDFGLSGKVIPRLGDNNNAIKFRMDEFQLRRVLMQILQRHPEIEESGNSTEKQHYALIKILLKATRTSSCIQA
ncbi:MAG: hypothetical protein C5B47_03705 [Verrucomicrobia bacterium]|nr:MAG: hypothetical protein C5B47_03705 [Verrucomicrobiota bacterium]